MRGIGLDAIFIALGILAVALLLYRLWIPPLVRLIRDVKDDIDKTNRDLLD